MTIEPKAELLVLDRIFGEVRVPEVMIGTNVVHLPTVKTHVYTTMTGAMKNAFGGLLRENRHCGRRDRDPALRPPGARDAMKFAFPMPHMVRLKAMAQPWEAGVTGADQTRIARRAEELGYDMIGMPEHLIIPSEHVDLSGPHYFHAAAAQGYFAGATSGSASTPASRSFRCSTRS